MIAKEVWQMSETTNLTIRMDKELKKQAEQLFFKLGMNMTTAFTVFVRQAVRQGKIPFEISLNIPNAETIAAMEEANKMSRDPNTKRYSSFDELVAEVRNEV
jgi:DNA-damage-inducible protein J